MLEPVQGEGGFIPMPPEFVARAARALRHARNPLRRRRGAVRLRTHRHDVGDRALRRRAGPARLRQDARRRTPPRGRHRDAPSSWTRSHPGGLGGTFGGNPVACAAALAVLDELSAPGFRERAEQIAQLLRDATRRDGRRARDRRRGARASARCSPSSSPSRTATPPQAVTTAAREKRARPPLVRPLRQRDPAAAAAVGDGRRARARARDPGGGSWRRRLRLSLRRAAPAASPAVRLTGIRRSYGDVRRDRPASTSTSPSASSSPCSARRARARRRRCG